MQTSSLFTSRRFLTKSSHKPWWQQSCAMLLLLLQLLSATRAVAETTRFYELEGFSRFLDGNPESVAVTEEGSLALPPRLRERFADAAISFSAACGHGSSVFMARSEDAQIFRLAAQGKLEPFYKPDEALVTALLVHRNTLLIATAPEGKIYQVALDAGKTPPQATLWYAPAAHFVWSMVAGPDDSVLLSTGEPGSVVQVERQGRGKILFQPDQAHLRALAYHPALGIFVGGGEHGVVYRAAPHAGFRALFDTGTTEITAIVLNRDSAVVAGVSGAAALLSDDPKKAPSKAEIRSQIMRLAMDGTAEVLAGSNDEVVFAMSLDHHDNVLVATGATGRDDPRGRVYSIDTARRVIALVYQSPSRRLTHLVPLTTALPLAQVGRQPSAVSSVSGSAASHGMAVLAAAGGRITELAAQRATEGTFYSQPFDAGIHATYGLVQVLGHFPAATQASVALRTGETAEPDATWSPWSKPVAAPGNTATPQTMAGRYLQVRITLRSATQETPWVQRLRVAYLRQNLPPFVHDVVAMPKGTALYALPRDDSSSKNKIIALSDKVEDPRPAEQLAKHLNQVRARQAAERGSLTIKWAGDDPNGDTLRYALYVRRSNATAWRLLQDELTDPFYNLQTAQFADGYYIFQVRAHDKQDNPEGQERSDQRDSRAVLIDNQPPRISPIQIRQQGNQTEARATVSDALGPITELTYALDNQPPRPILPNDGILDGPIEPFTLNLGQLPIGPHSLVIRAVDDADNEAFAEAEFTSK